jgi:aerobic carbon-monoxide dehydrogenase large subunit
MDDSRSPAPATFGARQRRLEDARLLVGNGAFLDDLPATGVLRLAVLRSPHAHARIVSIDPSAARTMPGVVLILTGADLDADSIRPISAMPPTLLDGTVVPMSPPAYELLARTIVRHIGEPVAIVAAETQAQAQDAAEAISVMYQDMPACLAPVDAGAVPGFEIRLGDAGATQTAFDAAHAIVEVDVVNQRVSAVPMEARGVQAEPDGARIVLRTGTQAPHLLRRVLAKDVFGWSEDRLRVVTPDTGGGFGAKAPIYREHGLAVWAAFRTNRKVRWISSRSEAFLSDTAGRDMRTRLALAFDADGRVLALKASIEANLGAYLSFFGAVPANIGLLGLVGPYAIPTIDIRSSGAFTNTAPVDAYRGAGRPEAIYALERAMDKAGRRLGLSQAEIRRRNLVPKSAMPYRTAVQTTFDSGDFPGTLEKLVQIADLPGLNERRAASASAGRLRGFGLAYYIERAAGGAEEAATIVLDANGGADVMLGTMTAGQGHATAYTQIVANRLGLEPAHIRIHQGDTDVVARGVGTFGSRSLPVGGSALHRAVDRLIEIMRPLAADLLEANAADIEFNSAEFRIVGTDRRMSVAELAKSFHMQKAVLPGSLGVDLSAQGTFQPVEPTFPNGCHACEVEIDPETGAVALRRYCAVDDFGNEINPLLVDGQVHGGIAQGVGQALLEHMVYDLSGQLLTGSLMDYALPRADDLPHLNLVRNADPCRNNPLGLKGCAEAGAVCAPPAVIHAILDALAPLGVKDIDMPATPSRIWSAIMAAAKRKENAHV